MGYKELNRNLNTLSANLDKLRRIKEKAEACEVQYWGSVANSRVSQGRFTELTLKKQTKLLTIMEQKSYDKLFETIQEFHKEFLPLIAHFTAIKADMEDILEEMQI